MQALLPILLVIHIIACVALVIAVMLQRSEGGALGMGGGGTGGIISGRGVANVLVRTTMGLAAVFFVTSVLMARLNTEAAKAPSAVEKELQNRRTDAFDPLKKNQAAPAPAAPDATAPATTGTTPAAPVLDPLAAPTNSAPAATPAPATSAPKPEPATTTAPKPKAEPAKPSTAPASPAIPPPAEDNGR
jgi:preprotein translocase subunit SecG